MVKLIGKVRPSGNSYVIRIKKALVDAEVLEPYKEYEFVLVEKEVKRPFLDVVWRPMENIRNYFNNPYLVSCET